MKVKTCAYLTCLTLICLIYYLVVVDRKPPSPAENKDQTPRVQGAIVVLTRGNVPRLLNMLHSIEYFFPQAIDRYPVIVFYDPHGTRIHKSDIDRVRSCVKLQIIFETVILFDLMKHQAETIDKINRESQTNHQRPIGYRFKCQFWSHTVFHHPAIKNRYDYIMRIDDDSYFLQSLPYDLFQYAYEHRLDYIYRALEPTDDVRGTNDFLRNLIETYHHQCKHFCLPFRANDAIHTGFFVSKLQIWYNEDVERLSNYLLKDDTLLTESLDDGHIHPVVLTFTSNANHVRLVPFAYAHNVHLYAEGDERFDDQHDYHNWFDILANRSAYNCQQLVIIDPASKHLKYIDTK